MQKKEKKGKNKNINKNCFLFKLMIILNRDIKTHTLLAKTVFAVC